MRRLIIFLWSVSVLRGADAPPPFDRAAAQKWGSIVEWIGFWDASETRTKKYENSLNASLWSDSLQDAQTSSQFRLRRAPPVEDCRPKALDVLSYFTSLSIG